MRVIEQYTQAKHSATPSEDQVALTATVAAVIDGATPKSAFRFPDGETPGHFAARRLREAIGKGLTDPKELSLCLLTQETIGLPLSSRPTASLCLYDEEKRCVIQVGDAPFAFVREDIEQREPRTEPTRHLIEYRNEKEIDHVLSAWRSSVLHSMLNRGVIRPEEIIEHDPARRLIQPFITRQVTYQNTIGHRYSFGVMDGQKIPKVHIRRYPVPAEVQEIILASDGFPRLFPTLQQSLNYLIEVQKQDPLCIDKLCGTKGLRTGATWSDDVTYVRIAVE